MLDKMNNSSIIPPPPPHTSFENILLEICGHLRCRFTKNSPRRTTSTPAGIFCALLVSASPISKRHFSTAMDGGGSIPRQQMYIPVHLLTRYLYRLFQKVFSHYTAHLLRYCAQINPHRIKISIPDNSFLYYFLVVFKGCSLWSIFFFF